MLSNSYTIQIVTSGSPASSYLTSTVDKTRHGPVIALFLCNGRSFFNNVGGCTSNQPFLLMEGRFGIIFLICNNLLICFRRVGTIAVTTDSLKVIFTKKILTGSSHFSLLWCIPRTTTPEISRSSEIINNTARVSRLSFHFLWRCSNI